MNRRLALLAAGAFVLVPLPGRGQASPVTAFIDYGDRASRDALAAIEDRGFTVEVRHLPGSAVSAVAAAVVVAAGFQGRVVGEGTHKGMLSAPVPLTPQAVFDIAGRAGADMERLGRDVQDDRVAQQLAADSIAAAQAGLKSAPGFLVDGRAFQGFSGADR